MDTRTGPQWKEWGTADTATEYGSRDLTLAHLLGYPSVLRALGFPDRVPTTILDVGCGTGVLARQIASTTASTVIAVDPSAHMLGIARAEAGHPRVDYRQFDGQSLANIPDRSIPAVMSNLVYCTEPSTARLGTLTAEIHRVLEPGGVFALLDLWPGALGQHFSTLDYGEPGRDYADESAVPTLLRRHDGPPMRTICYHRTLDTYRRLLTAAGFAVTAVETPTVADVEATPDPDRWDAELTIPPYMIISSRRDQ